MYYAVCTARHVLIFLCYIAGVLLLTLGCALLPALQAPLSQHSSRRSLYGSGASLSSYALSVRQDSFRSMTSMASSAGGMMAAGGGGGKALATCLPCSASWDDDTREMVFKVGGVGSIEEGRQGGRQGGREGGRQGWRDGKGEGE